MSTDTLSVEQVRAAVADVEAAARGWHQAPDGRDSYPDSEQAHALQDALYEKVLAAIANGAPDAHALAAAALAVLNIDFTRWCS